MRTLLFLFRWAGSKVRNSITMVLHEVAMF